MIVEQGEINEQSEDPIPRDVRTKGQYLMLLETILAQKAGSRKPQWAKAQTPAKDSTGREEVLWKEHEELPPFGVKAKPRNTSKGQRPVATSRSASARGNRGR